MSAPLREEHVVSPDGRAGGHPHASGDASHDVLHDRPVEVWENHHVELRWILDKLHAAVVDDHFFVLDERVFLRDFPAGLQEHAVNQLHDVGLVNGSDLFASAEVREFESVFSDS